MDFSTHIRFIKNGAPCGTLNPIFMVLHVPDDRCFASRSARSVPLETVIVPFVCAVGFKSLTLKSRFNLMQFIFNFTRLSRTELVL